MGRGRRTGGGSVIKIAPFQLNHFVSTGQSLGLGYVNVPVLSTVETLGNLALHDSSGTYDTSNPSAGTLSLASSAAPIRTIGSGAYPSNINGEIIDSRIADQLATLAASNGYPSFVTVQSVTGQGGQAMSVIKKGGTGNAYVAGTYEVTAVHNLRAGKTHGVLFTNLTEGEADGAANSPTYATDQTTLQANYQTDLTAITGQTNTIPMMVTQMTSENPGGTGPNVVALAQLTSCQSSTPSNLLVPVCTKYPYTYGSDNLHLANGAQYRLLGEKIAQVAFAVLNGSTWTGCTPKLPSIFASGSTITVPCNVPFPPLVRDLSYFPAHPHGASSTGYYPAWALGGGFEVYDHILPGTVSGWTNASPPVITMTSPLPGWVVTGTVLTMWGLASGTASAAQSVTGTFAVTVTGASTFSLNGVGAPGAIGSASPNSIVAQTPTISSVAIQGSNVVITCNRTLNSDAVVSYAHWPETGFGSGLFNGGYAAANGRFGEFRDSDTTAGISGTPQANWLWMFYQALVVPAIVSATAVPSAGGTSGVVGSGFVTGATATIDTGGAKTPVTVTFISSTNLSLAIPATGAGTYNVVITNPSPNPSDSGASGASVLTVSASSAATVTSIAPPFGTQAGGTAVTITGTNFTGVTSALVGGVPVTSFVQVNSTTITGVVALASVSNADVSVFGGTLSQGYTYMPSTGWTLAIYGEAGITTSGSNLTGWADQSGAGHNFTTTNNPTWNANGIATGRGAATLTRSSSTAINSASALSAFVASNAHSIYVVTNPTSATAGGAEVFDGLFNDANGYLGLGLTSTHSNSAVIDIYDGTDHIAYTGGGVTYAAPIVVTTRRSAGTTTIQLNSGGTYGSSFSSNQTSVVSGAVNIGGGTSGTHGMTGQIAAVFVWNNDVGAANDLVIRTFLKNYYSIGAW